MSLWAGVLSAKPSWGFSLHRSTEQTALMRTQIPSCCIDLQNRCIGEGKSMTAERPPSTRWPAGDLNKKSWRASACRTQQGKRPHYHSVCCASNYLSVFLSPDSELLQGRSYTCFNKADCTYNLLFIISKYGWTVYQIGEHRDFICLQFIIL